MSTIEEQDDYRAAWIESRTIEVLDDRVGETGDLLTVRITALLRQKGELTAGDISTLLRVKVETVRPLLDHMCRCEFVKAQKVQAVNIWRLA